MGKDKRDRPGISTWLMCPVCQRRDFRYRARKRDYICKVCGTAFHADFRRFRTFPSVQHQGQENVGGDE